MSEILDLFGFPATMGQHGEHNAGSGMPHGVPKSRSCRDRKSRDTGGPIMTAPDLFSTISVPTDYYAAW